MGHSGKVRCKKLCTNNSHTTFCEKLQAILYAWSCSRNQVNRSSFLVFYACSDGTLLGEQDNSPLVYELLPGEMKSDMTYCQHILIYDMIGESLGSCGSVKTFLIAMFVLVEVILPFLSFETSYLLHFFPYYYSSFMLRSTCCIGMCSGPTSFWTPTELMVPINYLWWSSHIPT